MNKENATQIMNDARLGNENHNLKPTNNQSTNKTLKVLGWLYQLTKLGDYGTSFASFNANSDTAFRTHVSMLDSKYGIYVSRTWLDKDVRYKKYWLQGDELIKAEKLLKSSGYI